MPGTILVSVLEFMDLPFSSSTPIRASMGKIEYQISDKGSFSFPIASLRDDLIFKIHDSEGNELSRAGVYIRMILEKGVWEDTFPLGEGYLHLRLQVVLSDEERDRIRMMRQSALKKKQEGLLNSSKRGAESERNMTIRNAGLPFRASDEVSVMNLVLHAFPQRLFPDVLSAPSSQESSPKQYLQHEEASQLRSPVDFSNDRESSITNVAEAEAKAELEQKQLNSNIADQYKKTASIKPVSEEVNLIQLEDGGKKPANQPPSENHPQKATDSEEMVFLLSSEKVNSSTNTPIQDNQEDVSLPNSEKKARLGRTPSNVKKMISAFESGLPKDMRPHIKPPPTKYQASPIEKRDSSGTRHLEQDKSLNMEQEKSKSASLVKDLQEVPENIEESKEQIHIPKRQMNSNARNKDQEEETNENAACSRDQEEGKDYRNSTRTSTYDSGVSYESCIEKDLDKNHHPFENSEARIFAKIENLKKNAAYIETETDGSKYEKIQKIEESKTNISDDDNADENSGGPFNQVIKVAIIIGFGFLVLLTRQRNKRRKEKSA
ncbi:uncharacterized protein LOC127136622 isoform X1 [Lathyrus oleraceus]|uniref:uncharacterized protein LOC127136622 isoform X1 n=2 Tax=Pisum sativum TaxID=3888 RepID=UPI0021D07AD6|nr:uncharacterized protein LOC127136622 isoform X1 [Pisum sativum]